ncbi:MAG: DNRLRE domain-containing protein, partial [Anaerolineae bacterium]|nr:DNRLRE domain-containing protein [Anaerolineae bacterium]
STHEASQRASYLVKVIFLNQGTDTLALEYYNTAGEKESKTLVKGPALGEPDAWVSHTFYLTDARFDNDLEGQADFRLSSQGDGDEIVHLVEVSGLWGDLPVPTPGKSTPTPTRTATPTSPSVTVRASSDAPISAYAPDASRGDAQQLPIDAAGDERILLSFDLSELPAGAHIQEAILRLYATNAPSPASQMDVYGLRRAWEEQSVSWEQSASGQPWTAPGASGLDTDRDALPAAELIAEVQGWHSWNVTDLARAWISGGRENHGLILIGRPDVSAKIAFSSREGNHAPELVLRYRVETPSSPTSTPQPTAPVGSSPITGPTMAPPPTRIPGGELYGVRQDTSIKAWFEDTNYDRSPYLSVRQGDRASALVLFDLTDLPPDAQVQEARLNLYIHYRSNRGTMTLEAYRVKRPWVSDEATWLLASQGVPWSAGGCNDTPQDRDALVGDSRPMESENAWVSLDVTDMVRDWALDPASNHGLILKGTGGVAVQYGLSSSEWDDPAFRPQLVVRADLPKPTKSPSPTATPVPEDKPTPDPGLRG